MSAISGGCTPFSQKHGGRPGIPRQRQFTGAQPSLAFGSREDKSKGVTDLTLQGISTSRAASKAEIGLDQLIPSQMSCLRRGTVWVLDVLNELVMRTRTQIEEIVVSDADKEALKKYINEKTATFVVTPHPEYFTDAQIDRWMGKNYYPNAIYWLHSMFFLPGISYVLRGINAIPHTSGEVGKNASVEGVMRGKAVLLHPGGRVNGVNDKIQKAMPGVVDMSQAAAERSRDGDGRPVYVLPLMWKYVFNQDVTPGLQREMKIIEGKMKLPVHPDLPMAERYFELQKNILMKLCTELGKPQSLQTLPLTHGNFFRYCGELQDYYMEQLEGMLGEFPGEEGRVLSKYEKILEKMGGGKTPEEKRKFEKATCLLEAVQHLNGMAEDVYNSPTLTQEQVFESLKRIRRDFNLDWYSALPPAVAGPRKAYIRVGKPIDVSKWLKAHPNPGWYHKAELWAAIQQRMQHTLDDLNSDLEPKAGRYRFKNKFFDKPLYLDV